MTEQELSAIEARQLATKSKLFGPMENAGRMVEIVDEDVPGLVAEVRRLQALRGHRLAVSMRSWFDDEEWLAYRLYWRLRGLGFEHGYSMLMATDFF